MPNGECRFSRKTARVAALPSAPRPRSSVIRFGARRAGAGALHELLHQPALDALAVFRLGRRVGLGDQDVAVRQHRQPARMVEAGRVGGDDEPRRGDRLVAGRPALRRRDVHRRQQASCAAAAAAAAARCRRRAAGSRCRRRPRGQRRGEEERGAGKVHDGGGDAGPPLSRDVLRAAVGSDRIVVSGTGDAYTPRSPGAANSARFRRRPRQAALSRIAAAGTLVRSHGRALCPTSAPC